MENLELLRGVVSEETFARLEEETKDSTIRLGDLSTGIFVSKDKYFYFKKGEKQRKNRKMNFIKIKK